MNLLNDIITYVRRIIKSPSDAVISDNLIIDYINRFWIIDVDARMQLFDLKTKYQFQTSPGVDQYNMPLYSVQTQPGGELIGTFPVYQGFTGNALVNGVPISFETRRENFFGYWFNYVQNLTATAVGDGTAGPYQIIMPVQPNGGVSPNPPYSAILRGHVDITGIIALNGAFGDPPIVTNAQAIGTNGTIASCPVTSALAAVYITSIDSTGQNVVVSDSGQFLLDTNVSGSTNYGLLMQPGQAPNGNRALPADSGGINYSITTNTVNYLTGVANVIFPEAIPVGMNINAQCYFFQTGLPRAMLYYNNTITLRSPPAQQYLVELDAYLSPAAFLNTGAAIPFGYMAEYIARGAARKILSDTGDQDQFMFYEPLFREQEMLVWKRSQRQFTANRTQTLYSQGNPTMHGWGNFGGWSS